MDTTAFHSVIMVFQIATAFPLCYCCCCCWQEGTWIL